ncbi:Kinesin light chain [Fusarium albosuccineum]|uniref:Kinesin light chain n=1 Tax=Fusarium albosuccineum TaxID=1237068 RepID=A0A8H4P7P1_9HYPO|nr:Kinesin light chain [Fusarium albosuccineum]
MVQELTAKCKLVGKHIPCMIDGRAKSNKLITGSLERQELHPIRKGKGPDQFNYPSHLKAASILVAETVSEVKDPDIFSADRQVGQSWEPWFGTYECENHHVTAKFEDGTLDVYNDVLFEIQVTSLPASLYNKISPLHYKKEVGDLSRRDEIVTDHTKELALCYSLSLYYKKDTLEPHQTRIMREAAFPLDEDVDLGVNKLVGMLPSIPELNNAYSDAKCILRKTLQLAVKSCRPIQATPMKGYGSLFPAGTGKSTLARTMADELTKASQIAAGYFF